LVTSSTSSTELYELNVDYSQPTAAYGIANTGTSMNLLYSGSYPSKDHQLYVGDFNGDGKQDLLTWLSSNQPTHIGNWQLAYSTGAGGNASTAFDYKTAPSDLNPYAGSFPNYFNYFIGDFDGNGKDDILQMDNDQWNPTPLWTICYYSGYNQTTAESFNMSGFPVNTGNYGIGDFNGDGQADLLWSGASGGGGTYPIIVYFHKNDLRQLVSSITNAGRRIEVENANLPQMTDYTTYPSPNSLPVHLTFPFISRQIPMNVTSGLKDYVASSHSALSLDKSYIYSSLVLHLQGLGFQGFAKMETIDNSASTITIDKYHNTYNEPVTYLDSSETWDLTTYNGVVSLSLPGFPNNTPLHQKTQTMTDWGSGLVHNLTFDVLESNFVDATWSRVYPVIQNVSFFNDYGQPDSMIEIKGEVRTSKAYTYDPNAAFVNAGRPISTVITTTRDGKPSYVQKVNRTYLGSGDVLDETVDPGTTHETLLHLWYDNFGNVVASDLTPNGLSTTSTSSVYSSDGRFKLSHTDNMGFTSSCTYNDWGQKLTVTESNGLTTRMTFDPFGREDSTITPTGGVITKTYDWASNNPSDNPSFQDAQFMIQQKSDDITNITFSDYYKKELRTVKQDFSGQKIYKDTKYLLNGAVDYSTVSYYANSATTPNTTTFTYDSYGRVASSSMTYGPTVQTVYSSTFIYNWGVDGMASTTWTANVPQWNQKTVSTDGSGVKVSVSEGNNAIHYDYNSNGKMESIQINNDPNYQTQYTYDDFGRMTSKYQYNMGTTTYEYNALNQLIHEHYGLATDIYYTYDDLGRLTQKTNPDGNFDYTYNNIPNQPSTGTILSITSPYSTSYSYLYDNFGRKIEFDQQTPGGIFVTQYSYDIHNRELTHTYPDGDVIQKNYNKFGYLESIDLIGGTMPNQRLWQITGKNELDQTTSADYFDVTGNPLYTLNKSYDQGYPATIQFSKYMQPNIVDLS
jgi:YD repeat-containing protein